MKSVTLDSEKNQDVNRCSFAIDVGDFAEPRKTLVSFLSGTVDRSQVFTLPHTRTQHSVSVTRKVG